MILRFAVSISIHHLTSLCTLLPSRDTTLDSHLTAHCERPIYTRLQRITDWFSCLMTLEANGRLIHRGYRMRFMAHNILRAQREVECMRSGILSVRISQYRPNTPYSVMIKERVLKIRGATGLV